MIKNKPLLLIFFHLVIAGLPSFVMPCLGQENVVVYTNYQAYLTNRPWVTEMVVDMSMNHFSNKKGFTTWRASVQPKGFFFQCLSNSPFSKFFNFGESSHEYWQIAPNIITTSSKNQMEGGSISNRLQRLDLTVKQKIGDVLNFGIGGLCPSYIKWISPDEFTSPLEDAFTGMPMTGNNRFDVKIDEFYQGLPSRLHYTLTTDVETQEYSIICKYDHPVLPPTTVIIKWSLNAEDIFYTNIIRSIEFGLRGDAAEGFYATNFLMGENRDQVRNVESNGVNYYNGVARVDPSKRMAETHNDRVKYMKIILGLFIILPLVAFIYSATRRKPE
jgi:hypothetical protein